MVGCLRVLYIPKDYCARATRTPSRTPRACSASYFCEDLFARRSFVSPTSLSAEFPTDAVWVSGSLHISQHVNEVHVRLGEVETAQETPILSISGGQTETRTLEEHLVDKKDGGDHGVSDL